MSNPNDLISYRCRNRMHDACRSINCACACHRERAEADPGLGDAVRSMLAAATDEPVSVTPIEAAPSVTPVEKAERALLMTMHALAAAEAALEESRSSAGDIRQVYERAQNFRNLEKEMGDRARTLIDTIKEASK